MADHSPPENFILTMHFGKVVLRGKEWRITAEPHVRARLKRLFPRAPQGAADFIDLSATPEHARELEWFLLRYPMSMSPSDEARLLADSHKHEQQENELADALASRIPPPDIELAKPPREYQRLVPQILKIRGGLLLADDLGIGKTVSGICCLADPDALPAVIVCPPHLETHWRDKIKEFLPALDVHIIKQSQHYALARRDDQTRKPARPSLPDVLVVSYYKMRAWAESLASITRLVIFEECHQLRNQDSAIYKAAKYLAGKAQLRLGLSATPIFNYGSEFFWVTDVLLPGALGGRDEFIREWCRDGSGQKARISDTAQFGAYLRREGIMLRRTRAEVGRELPALTKITHTVDSDAEVLNQMTGGAVALAKIILQQNEKFRGERMQAAGQFDLVMRQATGVAKAPYVAELVRLMVENGEKVLLFGWHRSVFAIWGEKLKDLGVRFYTGTEDTKDKAEALEAFKGDGAKVLIMSLRSGVGVDGLQDACRTVVFGELDWSPGIHEQCAGRLHRDGQQEPVCAYYMIAEDGSDPIVADVLGVKREQIEGVRNPDTPLTERLETGENNLRQLARALLERSGHLAPAKPAARALPALPPPAPPPPPAPTLKAPTPLAVPSQPSTILNTLAPTTDQLRRELSLAQSATSQAQRNFDAVKGRGWMNQSFRRARDQLERAEEREKEIAATVRRRDLAVFSRVLSEMLIEEERYSSGNPSSNSRKAISS